MLKRVLGCSLWAAVAMFPFGAANALSITHNERTYDLALDELVTDANYSVHMYAPFRGKEIEFDGYLLKDFLNVVTGQPIERATVYAIDGYSYDLADIQASSWVLVTKEDGHRLTIREHGPLRLIETELNGRDPQSLAMFDNWVWMVDRIVVDD